MRIDGKVAVVTGAGSGIGQAVSQELAKRRVKGLMLVDRSAQVDQVAAQIRDEVNCGVEVRPYIGDVTDQAFRRRVFDEAAGELGVATICVPAAGVTRDRLAVKVDKDSGQADLYPIEDFRLVMEVNLVAPVYWAMEMIGRIAEDRFKRCLRKWTPSEGMQGAVVFIGSVSSQGNRGQISYSATKAGLEGACATLTKESVFHGVRCGLIHPGFTDTPMVRALGDEYIGQHILPQTQLGRLIRPQEIADAICFMLENSAVSGELWADAGWHPDV